MSVKQALSALIVILYFRMITQTVEKFPSVIFPHIPCILILSKFSYSPNDAQVDGLKDNFKFTLKLTLKQLRHVSVQSHHHQGAHYSCLLKLQLLK